MAETFSLYAKNRFLCPFEIFFFFKAVNFVRVATENQSYGKEQTLTALLSRPYE